MYCYVFLIAVTTKKRLCTVPFAPWTRSRPGVSRSMRRREPRKPPCSRKRSISSWILLKWKPLMIRKEQNLCFDMLRCFLLFLFAWFFFQVFLFSDMNDSQMQMGFLKLCNFWCGLTTQDATSRPHCRDWQRIPCSKHARWKRRLHTQEAPKPNPPQPWMWTPDPPNSPPISAISQTAYSYYDSRWKQIRRTSCPKEHIHQAKRPRW